MPWTTVDHVSARYPRALPSGRTTFVETRIDDAEDELVHRIPDLASRVVDVDPAMVVLAPGQVPLRRVQKTVADAVVRLLLNPEGYTSFSRATGPFSESGTRAADTGAGRIAFTDEELDALRPPAKAPAGSIRIGIPGWRVP